MARARVIYDYLSPLSAVADVELDSRVCVRAHHLIIMPSDTETPDVETSEKMTMEQRKAKMEELRAKMVCFMTLGSRTSRQY